MTKLKLSPSWFEATVFVLFGAAAIFGFFYIVGRLNTIANQWHDAHIRTAK